MTSPRKSTLSELPALLDKLPPMTPAQQREQRISWTYGNCVLANPNVTRELVEQLHDEIHGKPEKA